MSGQGQLKRLAKYIQEFEADKITDVGAGDVAIEILKRYRTALIKVYTGSGNSIEVAREALGRSVPVVENLSEDEIRLRIANCKGYRVAIRKNYENGTHTGDLPDIIIPPTFYRDHASAIEIVMTRYLETKDIELPSFKEIPDWPNGASELSFEMMKAGKFGSIYHHDLDLFEVIFDDAIYVYHTYWDIAVCLLYLKAFGNFTPMKVRAWDTPK